MKNLTKLALGILTSVGGYLEVGSLGTALQAGAAFRYELLWAMALGTICLAFLLEMSGRLAAVSHQTVVGAMRKRFGFSFQVWPMTTPILVDLLVLASEIGGAAFALHLATGLPLQVSALPVAFLIWLVLWHGTFGAIAHGVALLGLVTLAFVVAAFQRRPDWHAVAAGLLPAHPSGDAAEYAYLAVSILGATMSPYLVTFYSSGAIEEQWSTHDLMPNRIVAALGMGFGCLISMAVVIVAGRVRADKGIMPESFDQAAGVLDATFGRWGFWLFCASLFIGCAGAALELALDVSYLIAQTFGWNWSENQTPSVEARFSVVYTLAIGLATLPALLGVNPLALTMFSMSVTVLALPMVLAPLVVLMNDAQYLKTHTNGWIANTAVSVIVLLSFVLALIAIPAQILGG